MFGSRRPRAVAAGFWVSLVAAAAVSAIPGSAGATTSAVTTPVFSDGFESGNLSQWTRSSGVSVQQQVTYAGSWAARATTNGAPAYAYQSLGTPLSELYYDGRFNVIGQNGASASLVRFRTSSAGSILTILRRSDNKLAYYNEVTGVTTVGPTVSAGAWHELEVHVLINGASSLIEVWLDGTQISALTKTDSLGSTPVGRVYIGDPASGRTFDYAFDNESVWNMSGDASQSVPVSQSQPTVPADLAVTGATQSSISIGWSPSTGNDGALSYGLFLNGARIGTTAATAYTFSSLACGTSYTLAVDALDAAGGASGPATLIAATSPCNDPTPPSAPSGLAVTQATTSSLSVAWTASTDNLGVLGYDLFLNGSKIGTTAATSYTFNGLACGTTYTVGVDSYDAARNISARVSLNASTSPCAAGSPGATAVSELVFPTNPGIPGATLPQHACEDPSPSTGCAGDSGFNHSDYEGWGNASGSNDRMKFVSDPGGSGKTVVQFDVYGTDTSDQFNQVKTNLWKSPADNCDGCEAWYAVGFYIPKGFVYPDTWFLLMQNHGGAGNPAQAIELRVPPGGGSVRNYIYWKDQTAPTSGWTYFPLGPVQEGHWVYIVAHIYLTTASNGSVQVWYKADSLPDVSATPAVNHRNINTLYPGYGAGTASLPLYRDAGPSSQHQIVYYCGYHRAATAASALNLSNCPTGN
jgi:chitodextrinase